MCYFFNEELSWDKDRDVMENVSIKIKCPRCHLAAEAVLEHTFHKFLIYTCPQCRSNVVYYRNKIDVISDRLLRKLLKRGKLRHCGNVSFVEKSLRKRRLRGDIEEEAPRNSITPDDVLNLKILLETEDDSAKVIERL